MDHEATHDGRGGRLQDEEAAFVHLEELLEALPLMQEKGALLASARHAEAVEQAAEAHDACTSMLGLAEERLAKAEKALAEARAFGEGATIDACRREALFAASLRGFRVGPARNAARALDEAVASSPFPDVPSARAARLGRDDLRSLEAEVDAYRKDYAATLALCERSGGGSDDAR